MRKNIRQNAVRQNKFFFLFPFLFFPVFAQTSTLTVIDGYRL
jgi:hypothetical protein